MSHARPDESQGWKGKGVLIAGGMGGVGRHLVRALARRGVAQLWLIGRRLPSPSALADWQRELAGKGVNLICWSVDLEDPAQLSELASRLASSPVPVSDVIHAAGRTMDAPLTRQTLDAFDQVAGVQLRGPLQLMAALSALPWRRFIVCGSAAGMVGSAAQAPYAAAHAVLAAWAQQQDQPQRRVINLAWGPWRDTGLAASPVVQQALESQGVALLDPQDACEGLFEMIAAGWSHAGLFHPRAPAPATHTHPADESAPAELADARRSWTSAAAAYREAVALESVHEQALAVLGHPADHRLDLHRGFFEIGFDSLSLMTFRQRLQSRWALDLPTTVAFEHPCLADLARHLHESMSKAAVPGAQPPLANNTAGSAHDEAVTHDPLEASPAASHDALARELAAIEKLLS